MSKIAIIYFSKTDVTGQLARAIAAGVEQQGIKQQGECEILSHRIEGSEIIEGRFVNPNLMDELARLSLAHRPTWVEWLRSLKHLPMRAVNLGTTRSGQTKWQQVLLAEER